MPYPVDLIGWRAESCFGKLYSSNGHKCRTTCKVTDECFAYQYVIPYELLGGLTQYLTSSVAKVRVRAKERLEELL